MKKSEFSLLNDKIAKVLAWCSLRSIYATHNTLSASLSAFGGTFWLSGCG
jgi:hypothetical protein